MMDKQVTTNEVLINKNSTLEELTAVYQSSLNSRNANFDAMVEFHDGIIDHTTDKEFKKIMTAVNKVLR
jgi:hypothetical protein